MVIHFPIFKLVAVGIRQFSRPIAVKLTEYAKDNKFLKYNMCIPCGQIYHYGENQIKLMAMQITRSNLKLQKLNEDRALEMGTQVLAELITFSIVATLITFEIMRQKSNDNYKVIKIQKQRDHIKNEFQIFNLRLNEHENLLNSVIQTFELLRGELVFESKEDLYENLKIKIKKEKNEN